MNQSIQTKVVRKNVKRLNMRFNENSELIITAPLRCPEELISSFIESNQKWIDKNYEKSINRTNLKNLMEIDELKEFLKDLTIRWSRIMNVDFNSENSIKFRTMKTRWGTCNYQKRIITYNLELRKYPLSAAEYVVVHELNHLIIRPNRNETAHSRRFWDNLSEYMPDYKARKMMLKNG